MQETLPNIKLASHAHACKFTHGRKQAWEYTVVNAHSCARTHTCAHTNAQDNQVRAEPMNFVNI
eukprot:3633827-Pleurochrysis_carterae.AAC.1